MNYWIVSVWINGVERTPLMPLFVTPFQAECFMRRLSTTNNYVRSVRLATWQEREERMFSPDPATGIALYTAPVWSDERWWTDIAHKFKDHYVHVSVADPDAIAFTEDPVKGEADRQTYMRPGKYLQKFLAAGASGLIEHGPMKGFPPQISKQQVAYYAAWHVAGKRPMSDDVLAFTEDADEMVRLYEDGPPSCMMGKHWSNADHPVRVYAGGGLALAYLTSASQQVIGRALCWPAREVFGRVYPTPHSNDDRNNYDELMARLKAMGWKSIEEDSSVFEGALLRQMTNRYGDYIMPYLDHEYGVTEVYREGRSWWKMTHEEDHQDGTDGIMGNREPAWTCESCDEGHDDDYDSVTVYRYWSGTRTTGYARSEQTWCSDCRDNNAFYCDGSEEHYVDNGDNVEVHGCTYERHWFAANGGWRCTWADEHYLRDDDVPVTLADGSLIHADYLDEASFVCFASGLRWPKDQESAASPGYHSGHDHEDQHPVEWECVVPSMPDDPQDVEAWALAHVIPSLGQPDAIVAAVYADLMPTYNAEIGAWADTLRQHLDAAMIATPRSWALVSNHIS